MSAEHRTNNRVRHWLWVAWLNLTHPFYVGRSRIRRAWQVQKRDTYILTAAELIEVTRPLDEHPDEWDYPCLCATCRSYAND